MSIDLLYILKQPYLPDKENMCLLGAVCRLLSVGFEKVNLTSTTVPFKLKPDNQCFKDLVDILCHLFTKPVKFYDKGLSGAIEFIYKVSYCSIYNNI